MCTTRILNRGSRVAALESELVNTSERGARLVAKALGTFAIIPLRA
ncbi:MAG: hypothetical protein FJZ92_13750 [Chloroflexi bacterium]|nr:hypothetical protein [Chloroflexota bacterium]